MAVKTKTGGKNKKFGRQENSPSHKRYNQEKRWDKNKLRRAEKYVKRFGFPVQIKIDDKLIWVR